MYIQGADHAAWFLAPFLAMLFWNHAQFILGQAIAMPERVHVVQKSSVELYQMYCTGSL